jgi:hypothetical protein
MKIKKFEEFQSVNESKIPFDDEIIIELKKLYKNTKMEKYGNIDERIIQLMQLHSKWIEKAKIHYSAEEIALKLIKYEKDMKTI